MKQIVKTFKYHTDDDMYVHKEKMINKGYIFCGYDCLTDIHGNVTHVCTYKKKVSKDNE